MSANVEAPSSSMDALKWIVAIALLAGAVIANNMFDQESVLIRAVGVVGALALAALQRSLSWKSFTESLMGATRTSAMIALIFSFSP